jgi:hypothetical protein
MGCGESGEGVDQAWPRPPADRDRGRSSAAASTAGVVVTSSRTTRGVPESSGFPVARR